MNHLPINDWKKNLETAVESIQQTADQLLECDSGDDARAGEIFRNWKLRERRQDEGAALQAIESAVGDILQAVDHALIQPGETTFLNAAEVIDSRLPLVESRFVEVRHCAQDLLHWAGRFTGEEGRQFADEYRKAYGELVRFTPLIKPRLESFRDQLTRKVAHDDQAAEEKRLLASLNRYIGVMEPAYGFIQAVAEPPLELVFEETGDYLESFRAIAIETRRRIASAINDCCQNLLYQPLAFEQRVRPVSTELPGDADSSVVVFETEGHSLVMAVDEDPIFGQMTIRLLGIAEQRQADEVLTAATEQLKSEWI